MSRVITFSRTYPAYHPKEGQLTYFAEKFLLSIAIEEVARHMMSFVPTIGDCFINVIPKHHTIREGNRWKVGDSFSPRVWGDDINPKSKRSGPYQSKQIVIGPITEIKKIWDIEIKPDYEVDEVDIIINKKWFCQVGSIQSEEISRNDGLDIEDLKNWFLLSPEYKKVKNFKGQIICWNENINY